MMDRAVIAIAGLVGLSSMSGCFVAPIPLSEDKVLAGRPVAKEQLSFLTPGKTTKEDVIVHLGTPHVIWEDARIFAYDWEMRQGVLVWAVWGLNGSGGMGGAGDISKYYLLLIEFDEAWRVQRFERATRSGMQTYTDFLRHWKESDRGTNSPGSRFETGESP